VRQTPNDALPQGDVNKGSHSCDSYLQSYFY